MLLLQTAENCFAKAAPPLEQLDHLNQSEAVSPLDQTSYFDQASHFKHVLTWDRPQKQTRADVVKEPLDELLAPLISRNKWKLPKPLTSKQIAECMRCAKQIMLAARAAVVSGNGYERFVNICHRINALFQCTERLKKDCGDRSEFESVAEGFKYLCSHQYEAYKNVAECIDIHSTNTAQVCERECHTSKWVVGWFFYGFLRSTLPMSIPEGDIPSKINVLYFRKLTSDSCTTLHCYMLCLRNRYNTKCGGVGGSLVLEAYLRPIAALYDSWALNPIVNTLKLILPAQCDFVTSDGGLNLYRLDAKQSQAIQNSFSANRNHSLVDLDIRKGSRTATELRAKLTSLLSRKRDSENDDAVRYPAITTMEPTDEEMHVGEVEEEVMLLKRIDDQQRRQLAVSNGREAR